MGKNWNSLINSVYSAISYCYICHINVFFQRFFFHEFTDVCTIVQSALTNYSYISIFVCGNISGKTV